MCRQVAGRAHPDLMVLERDDRATARPRKSIPVDEARALPEFFSKSPGRAAYRVAIIDAADDLNPNAANAVLKTLEEPPARGVLLLVSHAPGALLPTIRSRCRRLVFAAPPTEDAVRWLVGARRTSRRKRPRRCCAWRAARRAGRCGWRPPGRWRSTTPPASWWRGCRRSTQSAALALADSFRGAEGAAALRAR